MPWSARTPAVGCTWGWACCVSRAPYNPCCVTWRFPSSAQLAESIGCTAHLTVADGEEALALAVVEPSWTDFHVAYRVGSRHPLNRGAAGKAILAAREPNAAPYVATSGELQAGAQGVAAAVRGVEGLEASVGIVTLDQVDPASVGEQVATAAARGRKPAQLSGIAPGPGRVATSRFSVISWPSAQRMTRSTGAPQPRCSNPTGEPSGSAK